MQPIEGQVLRHGSRSSQRRRLYSLLHSSRTTHAGFFHHSAFLLHFTFVNNRLFFGGVFVGPYPRRVGILNDPYCYPPYSPYPPYPY
jgi:hypothetical protein